MAVKIRLARRGRKKLAMFDVVVADARSPRDGRFIEKLGTYNPNTNPATINLNEEKAVQWLLDGAQPSDTVRAMLSYKGVMLRKHLQLGVNKGAITQEVADGKFDTWKEEKESKIVGKADSAVAKRDAEKQARLDAEAKKNAARAEALAKKYKVEEPVVEAPVAAAPVAEEVEVPEVQATEVAPVEAQAEEVAAEAVVTEEAAPAAEVVEEAPAAEEAAPAEAEAPVAEETPAPASEETPAQKAE